MLTTKQHIDFGYNRSLRIKPFFEKLHYGVMLAMFRNSDLNVLKYEVTVSYLEAKDNYHVYEIERLLPVFVNEEEADLVADQLAIQVASALYPLQLKVSEQKGILGIYNFSDIKERWVKVKQKILDYNEGEIVKKYLRINESILSDEKSLRLSLRNDWFLHSYFNHIYIQYLNLKNQISVPFIWGANGVRFEIDQSISPNIDHRGYIISKMKGKCIDKRSKIDLTNALSYCFYPSDENVTGDYEAYYMLNGKDHSIDSFTIDTHLSLGDDEKTVSMVVYQIEKKGRKK